MSAQDFGKLAKKALIDKNMNQRQLAKAVGTSERYISHILTGRCGAGMYEAPIRAVLGMMDGQPKQAG
jgi:transcriptional regulator with XRE-family HTH domain